MDNGKPRKTCAVVITSYNRCDDLRRTCQELHLLDPPADEIVICLDGCTDGSAEMLATEFPEVRTIANPTPQGSIPSRDRAFRSVTSDLIITLDDDSYPTDPAFCRKIADLVEKHPEAGAFTFPEIRNDGQLADSQLSPTSPGKYIRDFANCAGVMVRACYGRDAQYPTFFSHAHAEPDYCLQLYAAGYAVWFEPSLCIRHHFTPVGRNMRARHLLNARNELWSAFMRCPLILLWAIAPWRVARQFMYALTKGWSWWIREPKWWLTAARGIPRCLRHRQAVDARSYLSWLRLARRPAFSLHELEGRFGRSFARPLVAAFDPDAAKTAVMITTRNRCADLRRTLSSLAAMNPRPEEILVTADACTDGTVDMVRGEFPHCRLWVNDPSAGSVRSRDRMLRAASGDLVLSLDDDSYPMDADFFARLPLLFADHPEAAVITFPEHRDGGVYATPFKTPHTPGHYVSAYPNCAAAMRRDIYLRQPGFPSFFVHMYEEPDYALQCYAAGSAVWFEPSLTFRHHLSRANRVERLRHWQNARNELWSAWIRCPWPWLPLVSLYRICRQFWYAMSEEFRWALLEPKWWWNALKGFSKCRAARRPVPWRTYYQWMRLPSRPAHSVQELGRRFGRHFSVTAPTPTSQTVRAAVTEARPLSYAEHTQQLPR